MGRGSAVSESSPECRQARPGVRIDSLADIHYILARKGAMGVVWLRISPCPIPFSRTDDPITAAAARFKGPPHCAIPGRSRPVNGCVDPLRSAERPRGGKS